MGHKRHTICKNCGDLRIPVGRGLCSKCHIKPAIRNRYPLAPSTDKRWSRRSPNVDYTGHSKPPKKLLTEPIGTIERLEQLSERAARGEAMFTPGDSVEIKGAYLICKYLDEKATDEDDLNVAS